MGAAAFANLERAAELLPALRARPDEAPPDLPGAVALFAGSQSLSEAAIKEPSLLAQALRDPHLPDPGELRERVARRIEAGGDDPRRGLRTFVRAETLRLLLADLTGRAGLEEVAGRLSRIAEATVDAALSAALVEARARYGTPRGDDGRESTITVIGLGKLGGGELNYSSDIDIVFFYSEEGRTDAEDPTLARRNRDFFARVVERTRRLLADPTPDGHCYRVDLRLRPEGKTGALTRSVDSALEYYADVGRPWERQALIKARPVAGDRDLGRARFVEPVASFVYGAPLRIEEIRSIRELKRAIERRGRDPREVKAGPGGIRDVEYTAQFLQLLNGHRYPAVRRPGTLDALRALEAEGALTPGERGMLEASYVFLRTVEHRLQTMHEV
ncbi:MAG: [protein-PII] uridylyltransferase family protein, partial [Planctomycetota bacterium]